MNRRWIIACIVSSSIMVALHGMEYNEPFETARTQVINLLSCYPIFEAAIGNNNEAFQSMLAEIRGVLRDRITPQAVEENRLYGRALEETIAAQKEDCAKVIRELGFEEDELIVVRERIAKIEKVASDFIESCDIRASGIWDVPVAISQEGEGVRNNQMVHDEEGVFGTGPLSLIASLVVLVAAGYFFTVMGR